MLSEAAYGTLQVMKDRFAMDETRSLTLEERTLLFQRVPWNVEDRRVVRSSLEKVVLDSIGFMGLPSFELPAEYVAAVITAMVAPVNFMAACSWTAGGHVFATELQNTADPGLLGWERARPHQLFAMVLELAGDPHFGKLKSQLISSMKQKVTEAQGGA